MQYVVECENVRSARSILRQLGHSMFSSRCKEIEGNAAFPVVQRFHTHSLELVQHELVLENVCQQLPSLQLVPILCRVYKVDLSPINFDLAAQSYSPEAVRGKYNTTPLIVFSNAACEVMKWL